MTIKKKEATTHGQEREECVGYFIYFGG